MAVVERWPPNRGFLSTGNAVETKVSGNYRESGRLSGVAVKRGSSVPQATNQLMHYNICSYSSEIIVPGGRLRSLYS